MSFLDNDFLKGTDWRAVERAIARTMSHCGWHDVRVVGGTGDGGGDILAIRSEGSRNAVFVVQVKAVTGGNYVGRAAIEEVKDALTLYSGNVGVVATNGDFADSTLRRRDELNAVGFDIRLWNGATLVDILRQWPECHHDKFVELRPYQRDIVELCLSRHASGQTRCQFVVATGLGKTAIASEIVARLLAAGFKRALVLCHQSDLALQLEQAFWRQIGKSIPTRVFFEGVPPKPIDGINFGLYQTLVSYLSGINPTEYDVVVIDEAHHALAHGFRRCLSHLRPHFLIGMTATPWRGDGASIETLFGPPVAQVSLVEGMQMGFLAKVDYRIFSDTIDWHDLSRHTRGQMTIRDLNKRLFIPQRDEAVIAEVAKICREVPDPHGIVFCASVEHAERFAELLSTLSPMACKVISGIDRRIRQRTLMDFGAGHIPFVAAVDVLNEGIDVPDVNLIVFLRSTHSRRIFVQQLGRGLRISERKKSVIVADFVTDIRRLAAVMEMDRDARVPQSKYCTLRFDSGVVRFEGGQPIPFVDQWLKDVADLADADEAYKLTFPEDV